MNYYKIIFIVFLILLSVNSAFAEKWVASDDTGAYIIYIDTDSVTKNNNGLFFNIRYYVPSETEEMIYTINAKDYMFGISNTCKPSTYMNNMSSCSTFTAQPASSMEPIDTESYIHNAFIIASNKEKFSPVQNENITTQPPSANCLTSEKSTISNQNNVDFSPYLKKLAHDIKKNRKFNNKLEFKPVTVILVIAKDGRLLVYSIESSGGSADDKSVIDAIKSTAPFEPLPQEYIGKPIIVKFTFTYRLRWKNNLNRKKPLY